MQLFTKCSAYADMRRLVLMAFSTLLLNCLAGAAKHTNPDNFDFIEENGWGDWTGVMTGRIIDEDGTPIRHARVRVHSKDIETRTDEYGFFTVRGLQKGGHYSLIVDAPGFRNTIVRWIPIPMYQTADIGDYHLDVEPLTTNFWQLLSNQVAGAWHVVSNYYDILDGDTNIYSADEWYIRTTDERLRHMAARAAEASNAAAAATLVEPPQTATSDNATTNAGGTAPHMPDAHTPAAAATLVEPSQTATSDNATTNAGGTTLHMPDAHTPAGAATLTPSAEEE